jgi:hypothetical protein
VAGSRTNHITVVVNVGSIPSGSIPCRPDILFSLTLPVSLTPRVNHRAIQQRPHNLAPPQSRGHTDDPITPTNERTAAVPPRLHLWAHIDGRWYTLPAQRFLYTLPAQRFLLFCFLLSVGGKGCLCSLPHLVDSMSIFKCCKAGRIMVPWFLQGLQIQMCQLTICLSDPQVHRPPQGRQMRCKELPTNADTARSANLHTPSNMRCSQIRAKTPPNPDQEGCPEFHLHSDHRRLWPVHLFFDTPLPWRPSPIGLLTTLQTTCI